MIMKVGTDFKPINRKKSWRVRRDDLYTHSCPCQSHDNSWWCVVIEPVTGEDWFADKIRQVFHTDWYRFSLLLHEFVCNLAEYLNITGLTYVSTLQYWYYYRIILKTSEYHPSHSTVIFEMNWTDIFAI